MEEKIFIFQKEKDNFNQVMKLFFDANRICIGAYALDVEKKLDENFGLVYYDSKPKLLSKEEVYEAVRQIAELKLVPFSKFDFHLTEKLQVSRTILLSDEAMLSLEMNSDGICVGGKFSLFRTMPYFNGVSEITIERSSTLQTEELLEVIMPNLLEEFSMKAEVPDKVFYQGKRVNVYPQIIGDQVVLFANIYSVSEDVFVARLSAEDYVEMMRFHNHFNNFNS